MAASQRPSFLIPEIKVGTKVEIVNRKPNR
jgi:hypothetical protein